MAELAREFLECRDAPEVRAVVAAAGEYPDPLVLSKLFAAMAMRRAACTGTKARLELLGAQRFAELLEHNGGTYSAAETGVRLGGITADAVRKRGKRLLSVRIGNKQRYPVWQFDSEGGLLPGFEALLARLATAPDLAKVHFFLTPCPELDGATPLQALRQGGEQTPLLARLATQFGQQGAT